MDEAGTLSVDSMNIYDLMPVFPTGRKGAARLFGEGDKTSRWAGMLNTTVGRWFLVEVPGAAPDSWPAIDYLPL